MADKKYNDYDPGVYDPNKIFLQADPITGALEKVNLPAIPSSPFMALTRCATFPEETYLSENTITPFSEITFSTNPIPNAGDTLLIQAMFEIDALSTWIYISWVANGFEWILFNDNTQGTYFVELSLTRDNLGNVNLVVKKTNIATGITAYEFSIEPLDSTNPLVCYFSGGYQTGGFAESYYSYYNYQHAS